MSRLTDYAVVVLTRMATDSSTRVHAAPELARDCGIPAPTVSKILKALARHALVTSHRGLNGGYRLARQPDQITVAQVMAAIEGPLSMTECSGKGRKCCELESRCAVRDHWGAINQAIRGVLDDVRLSDMVNPIAASNLMPPHRIRRTA